MTRLFAAALLLIALGAFVAPAEVPFDLRLYAGALSLGGCLSMLVRALDRRSIRPGPGP